jgi:hypothetical protein
MGAFHISGMAYNCTCFDLELRTSCPYRKTCQRSPKATLLESPVSIPLRSCTVRSRSLSRSSFRSFMCSKASGLSNSAVGSFSFFAASSLLPSSSFLTSSVLFSVSCFFVSTSGSFESACGQQKLHCARYADLLKILQLFSPQFPEGIPGSCRDRQPAA